MCRKDYEQTTIGNDNKTFFLNKKINNLWKKVMSNYGIMNRKKSGKKGKIEGKKRR